MIRKCLERTSAISFSLLSPKWKLSSIWNTFLISEPSFCFFPFWRSAISKHQSIEFFVLQVLNFPIEIRTLTFCQVLLGLTLTRDKNKNYANAWNAKILDYFQELANGFKVWNSHSKRYIWVQIFIWDSINDLVAFQKLFCFNSHTSIPFPCEISLPWENILFFVFLLVWFFLEVHEMIVLKVSEKFVVLQVQVV